MNKTNDIWTTIFSHLTLVLLSSILLGYFFSSLAFGLWFAFCLIWIIKTKHFQIDKLLLPFFVFGLFSFISIAWSVDKPQTIHALGRQAPLFLFAITGLFLPKLPGHIIKIILNRFVIFICGLSIIFTVLAIIKYYKYEFEGFLYYHELVSPIELNAIYVSYLVSFCFLYVLQNNTKVSLFNLAKLLMLGLFLIMLSSKMILFVTIVISVLIAVFKFKKNVSKLIVFALIFISITLVFVFENPIKKRFVSEFNTAYEEILNEEKFKKGRVYTGFEARMLQVRVFSEIMNTPKDYIIGLGLDASKQEITKIHQRLNTPVRFHTYNFHNQYLQIFAELGIVGLFLFIISLILALKRAFKVKYFLPFVVISMSLFITESVIWRQRGILFFGLLYILLFTLENHNESKKQLR